MHLISQERAEREPSSILTPLSEEQDYQHHSEEAFKPGETNSSEETVNGRFPESVPHSLSWYGITFKFYFLTRPFLPVC